MDDLNLDHMSAAKLFADLHAARKAIQTKNNQLQEERQSLEKALEDKQRKIKDAQQKYHELKNYEKKFNIWIPRILNQIGNNFFKKEDCLIDKIIKSGSDPAVDHRCCLEAVARMLREIKKLEEVFDLSRFYN